MVKAKRQSCWSASASKVSLRCSVAHIIDPEMVLEKRQTKPGNVAVATEKMREHRFRDFPAGIPRDFAVSVESQYPREILVGTTGHIDHKDDFASTIYSKCGANRSCRFCSWRMRWAIQKLKKLLQNSFGQGSFTNG
jgi:hypothetical protein